MDKHISAVRISPTVKQCFNRNKGCCGVLTNKSEGTHLTPRFVTVQVLLVLSDLGEDVPVELEGEAALLADLDLPRLQGVLQ